MTWPQAYVLTAFFLMLVAAGLGTVWIASRKAYPAPSSKRVELAWTWAERGDLKIPIIVTALSLSKHDHRPWRAIVEVAMGAGDDRGHGQGYGVTAQAAIRAAVDDAWDGEGADHDR